MHTLGNFGLLYGTCVFFLAVLFTAWGIDRNCKHIEQLLWWTKKSPVWNYPSPLDMWRANHRVLIAALIGITVLATISLIMLIESLP